MFNPIEWIISHPVWSVAICAAIVAFLVGVFERRRRVNALLGTVFWGFAGTFGLYLYTADTIPLALAVILWITAGTVSALILFLFFLPLIPNAINALANEPNRYKDALDNRGRYPGYKFGFFTFIQNGQVKITERGRKFIRCIMAFDGHCFRGELPGNTFLKSQADYWDVIKIDDRDPKDPSGSSYRKKRAKESHPIPVPNWWWGGVFNPFWLMLRWIYRLTGGVFTGIYPYQMIRIYWISQVKAEQTSDTAWKIEDEKNYSDHYRVAHFNIDVPIPEADSKDKIKVRMLLRFIAKCINPHKNAYNTDDEWVSRFATAATDMATHYSRSRPLDNLISADNEVESQKFAGWMLQQLNDPNETNGLSSLRTFGVELVESQILDISVVDDTIEKKLGDEAVAEVDRRAETLRGKGKAASIQATLDVMRDAGETGVLAAQLDAQVRAAEAAGKAGGIVIIGGSSVDPMQAAILKTLKEKA